LKFLSTLQRFLIPIVILVIFGPLFMAQREFSQEMRNVDLFAQGRAESLKRLLTVSENLMMDQVQASMRLLKEVGIDQQGTPNIDGETMVLGRKVPALYLGNQPQTINFAVVDHVTTIMGGTATLFVKAGENFVRVATNVKQNAETLRAVGTVLDPQGKAIQAIRKGAPFYGVVDILGTPYITGYEPMFDANHQVIGIWYVGFKVDIQALREAVESTKLLQSGFAAVLDANKHIRFLSKHVSESSAEQIIKQQDQDWTLTRQQIPEWGFEVVVAYPTSEAHNVSLTRSSNVLLIFLALGLVLIALVIFLMRRFVLRPLGGDPVVATELVRNISAGNLAEDGIEADEGTLMANMLKMRQNLRAMVETLHQNAERLSLSASVFEHAHDAIFIADPYARVIEVNPSFIEITGYVREEASGQDIQVLLAPEHDAENFSEVWQVVESKGMWRGETWLSGKHDTVFAAWLEIFAVRDERGVVRRYVGVFSDITPLMEQQQKLERMAYHDALTQLPNRALFSDRLQQALAHIDRNGGMLAVCYFDLDGFKPINDTLGHEAGDQLLIQLSQRLRTSLRAEDTVARLGGDEFALLLCGLESREEAGQTLERLLAIISAPYQIQDVTVYVSASAGITLSPPDDANPDILLRHADQAMYTAKLSGKNRYHVFDPEHDRQTRAQHEALAAVKYALDQGQFRLYYQPKVNMRSGKVIGLEALIRWQHPEDGLRPPSEFLPFVEDTDLSIELGEWVIHDALQQLARWQDEGLSIPVSVNITARHLMQPDFAQRLKELLDEFPAIPPHLLELEITESAALEDIGVISALIDECHTLGVTFALDDFGAGYSSLTYLRRLPVDVLKIDQSFVRDMLRDPNDMAIVAGVISLSLEFRRRVIAEGVETVEHGIKLLAMNCEYAQGYGIARPMPADAVAGWVASYRPDASWTSVYADMLIPR
jgi:diguanylate cyclase (GGDEF)-like protein/PAS domain S-box-containing protein